LVRPKIGLVLGGGGSRGIAHIGVLMVLVREKIPVDLIVGTSMGAIVGTAYALGYEPQIIADNIVKNLGGSSLLNLNFFSARARQRAVEKQLAPGIADKTFADLDIPVTVMTTDMLHGKEVPISEGPLMPALLASSAVPGVFPPIKQNGMELMDGGVIDSLATHVAFDNGAQKVIAVDVDPGLDRDNPWVDPISAVVGIELPFDAFSFAREWSRVPSAMASIWRSVRVRTIFIHEARLEMHPPDVLLKPDIANYASLDFKDIQGPMQAGINAAEAQIDAIRALVSEESARV
jgi:NTE family protein